jgi:lipopolysaccharide/colanic/teichoic acid biosynthesis glycosyltransferase
MGGISYFEKKRIYKITDFVFIFIIGLFIFWFILNFNKDILFYFLSIFLGFSWVLLLDFVGVYEPEKINDFKNSFINVILSSIFMIFVYALIYIIFQNKVKVFLFFHYVFSLFLLSLLKFIFIKSKIFEKFKKRILILSFRYKEIYDFLKNYPEYEIINLKGNEIDADEIILTYADDFFKNDLIKEISKKNFKIRYFEDIFEKLTGRILVDFLKNEKYLKKFLSESKKSKIYEISKRIFDLLGSVIGGIIYVFLLPFIILAVKIDSRGPLFYTHKRSGKNGKPFKIYKIRTMIKNAEKEGAVWAKKDDPRITKVGKILRKTRLDEFTQLFNILKGEMSAIGPRPERPEIDEKIKEHIIYYDFRYLVKPGMAGWAMINYDYVDSIEDAKIRQEYDLYYIKNRNFYLDFKIFFRAFFHLISFKGR